MARYNLQKFVVIFNRNLNKWKGSTIRIQSLINFVSEPKLFVLCVEIFPYKETDDGSFSECISA